jgi:hypothetical protein
VKFKTGRDKAPCTRHPGVFTVLSLIVLSIIKEAIIK